jgi:hypothetical protein
MGGPRWLLWNPLAFQEEEEVLFFYDAIFVSILSWYFYVVHKKTQSNGGAHGHGSSGHAPHYLFAFPWPVLARRIIFLSDDPTFRALA